jgi:hypothetical protein
MTLCASCGNDYEKSFTVTMDRQSYDFDCFECAINKLAPMCQCCGCKIIGHGIESDNYLYCCSHCLRKAASRSNEKLSEA